MDVKFTDGFNAAPLPRPFPVSLEYAISPIHHLLLSYPAPELVVPTRVDPLPICNCEHGQEDTPEEEKCLGVGLDIHSPVSDAATPISRVDYDKEDEWNLTDVQNLEKTIQKSIQDLLNGGHCTRFLQEEFHSQSRAARNSKPMTAATATQNETDRLADCMTTAAAVSYLHDRTTQSLMTQLSSVSSRTTTSTQRAGVKSAQSASSISGHAMNLGRGKNSPMARQEPQHLSSVPERYAPSYTKVESRALQKDTSMMLDVSFIGSHTLDKIIANINTLSEDAEGLLSFLHTPHLAADFIKKIPTAKLSALVSALVTESRANGVEDVEGSKSSPSYPKKWLVTARALCCVTLICCPLFNLELIPDGAVDRLISIFGGVLRCVATELSSYVAPTTVYENKATTRGRGTKGNAIGQDTSNQTNPLGRYKFSPPKEMLKWMEALRFLLQRFAQIVCNPGLNLVLKTGVIRLESLVYDVLFSVPHKSTEKEVYLWYMNYTADHALHIYRCLWNRLETERTTLARRFFPRLLLSNYLTFRTLASAEGKKLLPLTLALLSAAQSVTIDNGVEASGQAVCLQGECDLWAECLLRQLIIEHEKDDKLNQTLSWNLLTMVLEDLVDLIGSPTWPIADMLLQSCILSLIKEFLEKSLNAQANRSIRLTSMNTAHAAATIDVIAHVTLKLFHPTISNLSLMTEFQRLQEVNALNAIMSEALLKYWDDTVLQHNEEGNNLGQGWSDFNLTQHSSRSENSKDHKAAAIGKRKKSGPIKDDKNPGSILYGSEAAETSIASHIQRFIYFALSHYVETASEADEASLWFYVRAVHLLSWHLRNPALLPAAALNQLIRVKAIPCAGVQVDLRNLHYWGRTLCATDNASMLSKKSRMSLVTVLLNALYHKSDDKRKLTTASDAVTKKSLQCLSRIAEVYPSIYKLIWPIAQRCTQESSSRFREMSVSLLLTLLKGIGALSNVITPTSAEESNLVTKAIHLLLQLLEDKSVTVVSRAIVGLGNVLTNHLYTSLLESRSAAEFLSLIQYKLLIKINDAKHSTEVIGIFQRRWFFRSWEKDNDFRSTTMGTLPHIRLAAELRALLLLGAPEYPYELQHEHPLVTLLHGLRQTPTSTASPGSGEVGGISDHQQKSCKVDVDQIMCNVARSLWTQQQTSSTAEESVLCIATLHAVALAGSEWVEPLIDGIVSGLEYPPNKTLLFTKEEEASRGKEWIAGVILQSCQICKAMILSRKFTRVALDHLAHSLTMLLSKYVGPYQQRIIASSCAALTSMITSVSKHRFSTQINPNYLRLCYSLMNLYYIRVKSLLPELMNQPQNAAYIQRFLFLLSELLRSYPGWRTSQRVLLQDAMLPSGGDGIPNILAQGNGICENVYELVKAVRDSCRRGTHARLNVIVLRVLASLCMLHPSEFLPRCEAYVRESLTDLTDVAHHIQGLTFIVDFLTDESSRVELAARVGLDAGSDVALLSDSESEKSREGCNVAKKTGSHTRIRGVKRVRTTTPTASAALSLPEQSSGMATWVMQQFHSLIIERCRSPHVSVRRLCLDIIRLTVRGRLLPPVKYLHATVALAADVDPVLRQCAVQCLVSHRDRCEDVVASLTCRGIELAYDIHLLCQVNILQSAITSDEAALGQSVYAPLYELLHKPFRESLVVSLLRYFYDECKARMWLSEHDNRVSKEPEEDVFRISSPMTFLGHLAVGIATLPFRSENDILHLTQYCQSGIDLHGESVRDELSSLLAKYQKASERSQTSKVPQLPIHVVSLWKCVGVVLLLYIQRAVRTEFHPRTVKLTKLESQKNNLTHTPPDPQNYKKNTIASFLPSVKVLVRHASTLLSFCSIHDCNEHDTDLNKEKKQQKQCKEEVRVNSPGEVIASLMFLHQELAGHLSEVETSSLERGSSLTKTALLCQGAQKKGMHVKNLHTQNVGQQRNALSAQSNIPTRSSSSCSSLYASSEGRRVMDQESSENTPFSSSTSSSCLLSSTTTK